MNLPREVARAIATGRATQCRVPHTKGCPVKIGRDHPVQVWRKPEGNKRGHMETLCRVKALKAQGQRLDLVSFADARAMGYRTTEEFRIAWVRWKDRAWLKSQPVDVADDTLLLRFVTRWAGVVVWAITLELYDDRPRFLARVGGYVDTPALAIDDVEAIDAATQERYSKTADQHAAEFYRDLENARAAQRAKTRMVTHPAPWWKREAA